MAGLRITHLLNKEPPLTLPLGSRIMANIQKLTIKLSKAIAEKDMATIEQVYQEVEDYYFHLQSLDDQYITSQTKLQKWTTFWEIVCWEVDKARKATTPNSAAGQ